MLLRRLMGDIVHMCRYVPLNCYNQSMKRVLRRRTTIFITFRNEYFLGSWKWVMGAYMEVGDWCIYPFGVRGLLI